jgi:hypothetical protein
MASVRKTGDIHIVFVAKCGFESAPINLIEVFGDLSFALIGPPGHEPADSGEAC